MITPEVERELLDLLSSPSEDRQREVVEFARSLSKRLPVMSGKEPLKFAGCLSAETCDAMEKAIEEHCERSTRMAGEPLNELQQIHLELIRRTVFNAFDGKRVAHDLVEHRNLWRSASMLRLNSLISLRDIPGNLNNVDTLYVIPVCGKESELEALALTWDADSVCYMDEAESQRLLGSVKENRVLMCWWD